MYTRGNSARRHAHRELAIPVGDTSTHRLSSDAKLSKMPGGKPIKSFISKSRRVSWPRESKAPGGSSVSLFRARSLGFIGHESRQTGVNWPGQVLVLFFWFVLSCFKHKNRGLQHGERRQKAEYARRKLRQLVVIDVSATMAQQHSLDCFVQSNIYSALQPFVTE